MGNCTGRFKVSDVAAQPARMTDVTSTQQMMIRIPQRRSRQGSTPNVEDFQLDRCTLEHGLLLIAEYIHRRGQALTIIALGGATNTLLLQNRHSTHDVDFLGANLTKEQCVLLGNAARYAERRSPTPMVADWFNNEFVVCLPSNIRLQITQDAMSQYDVVFHRYGLKVLAAPGKFAFCCKLNRLSRTSHINRSNDVSDAVSYLHRQIQKNGSRAVHMGTAKEWARYYRGEIRAWHLKYHEDADDKAIREIAAEYFRLYRRKGILF